MAQENAYFGETIKSGSGMLAATDLSAAQYKAVTIGASGVSLVASAGASQVKVLMNKPKSGQPCALVDLGETRALAGGAITKGAVVMTDSVGRFVAYVNNGTNTPVGEARIAAGAAGDIITIFLWPTTAQMGPDEGVAPSDALTAHAGGGKASALVLGYGWNRVTTVGTATDSVLAPPAVVGAEFVLVNDAAANSLTIFGAGTDTIDGVATATGNPMAVAKRATFYCLTAGQWISNMGVKIA